MLCCMKFFKTISICRMINIHQLQEQEVTNLHMLVDDLLFCQMKLQVHEVLLFHLIHLSNELVEELLNEDHNSHI